MEGWVICLGLWTVIISSVAVKGVEFQASKNSPDLWDGDIITKRRLHRDTSVQCLSRWKSLAWSRSQLPKWASICHYQISAVKCGRGSTACLPWMDLLWIHSCLWVISFSSSAISYTLMYGSSWSKNHSQVSRDQIRAVWLSKVRNYLSLCSANESSVTMYDFHGGKVLHLCHRDPLMNGMSSLTKLLKSRMENKRLYNSCQILNWKAICLIFPAMRQDYGMKAGPSQSTNHSKKICTWKQSR